jgi:hypothetical protein
MSKLFAASIVSAVSLVGVGCMMDEPTNEPSTSDVEQQVTKCPPDGCSANSPWLNGQYFHELHTGGIANSAGFKLVGLVKGGLQYTVVVNSGRVFGRRGTTTISGAALVNTYFVVEDPVLHQYAIKISAWSNATTYWAKSPGGGGTVETYQLDWSDMANGVPTGGYRGLCRNPPTQRTSMTITLGQNAFTSVIFEGERINADTKQIAGIDSHWFNIGCAGGALAKMYLTGHVQAAQSAGFTTNLDERQTILKMFAADYCGAGYPFTVQGTPLDWVDDKATMSASTPPVSIEGRWNKDGAVCLDNPRIDAHPLTPEAAAVFPGGVGAAMMDPAKCPAIPPHCVNKDPLFTDGYHLVSSNY